MATTEQIIRRLGKLKSTLLTSALQKDNPPLYQVINQLLQAIIDSAESVVEITGGSSGGGPLSDRTFVTVGNELASLPQSSQIIAGNHISFDNTTFGQLRVDVLLDFLDFIINSSILTVDDESADFPNSRQLLAGTNITFDDSVANQRTIDASGGLESEWSVLTNGDPVNPELIFAGGDVIMLHTP